MEILLFLILPFIASLILTGIHSYLGVHVVERGVIFVDLALAQITAKWRGALKVFQSFQETCAKSGFELDLGIYLKNLIAFATGQSRFLTVGSLSIDVLQRAWSESVNGMEFALNFLRSNVGIDSPALLSSPFLLVSLGFYGHRRNYQIAADEAQRLRHWHGRMDGDGHDRCGRDSDLPRPLAQGLVT